MLPAGTLDWDVGDQYLGELHLGLAGRVFPVMSSVWGHCEEVAKVEVRRARTPLQDLVPPSTTTVGQNLEPGAAVIKRILPLEDDVGRNLVVGLRNRRSKGRVEPGGGGQSTKTLPHAAEDESKAR